MQTSPATPKIRGVQQTREHAGAVISVKARVVCKTCNNGWMSQLETQVKTALTHLISHEPCVLSEDEQRVISRWFVMKFMVLEFIKMTEPITPASERDFIFKGTAAPDTWRIWLGAQTGEMWKTALWTEAAGIGTLINPPVKLADGSYAKNTQAVAFGIGNLFILAIHTTIDLEYDVPPEFAKVLRQTWPFQKAIVWPPGAVLSDQDCGNISTAFGRGLANMNWYP
jgi:hypothetical protein